MKAIKLIFCLLLLSITTLTAISQEYAEKSRIKTLAPRWAKGVTYNQKRIITELINSMVYVEGGTF